jgi:PAS domain S-box-containing protein
MTGTDPIRRPDEAAVQFMIVDFLAEVLKFSASPSEMGLFLTRQLRELMAVRTVVMLQHGPDLLAGPARIVALEPERDRRTALAPGLIQVVSSHPDWSDAALFSRSSAPAGIAEAMDILGIASLSMTPLRVGDLRVGTLFALDHLDVQRTEDAVRLLNALSPVFALILRNMLFFESQAAKVLEQSEQQQALLRTTLDGYMVVSAQGAMLDANETYLKMTGYSLEEVRSLHVSNLEAIENRQETDDHSDKMMREGSDRFTSRHLRKDGTSFPVEVSTTFVPSQNLIIGFIRDLTDRVADETALRESESHHRELVEILGEGVAATDLHETIIMANPEADRIFGLGANQLVGTNLRAYMDDEDWLQITTQTTHRLVGRTDAYQVQIRRTDGSRRTLQLTATPRRDAAGTVAGSLAVFRDITDELKAQETLRLAQKMESLGNLAGGLAHDMNNVLGAILGLASTHLEVETEGTGMHATFATITKACLRGRNMVKSLLDFARKDVAGERLLSFNELLKEEARLLDRTLPDNVAIQLDLDAGAGTILGDPDALSLMLMNLCMNAMDAMPEGGQLTLGTRSLLDGRVLVAVTDTGTGMTQNILEHALEPFYTTKPQGKGTGLGLSLAYSTVKAHHGELSIQSRPGQGTTIEMRFQVAKGEDGTALTAPPTYPQPSTSRRMLLVDDDELIQSSVTAQLEALGHQVTLATRGEEAMDLIDRGLRPDLVILDMNMPGWGGTRTLPRLRATLPETPILLSTGRADQRAIDLARAFPGVSILAKPFSFRELQAAFADILPKA